MNQISATDISNTTRDVSGNVNERVRDCEGACPTSNSTNTGWMTRGTGKANAITYLTAIPKGVNNKLTFFRNRFWR